MSILGTWTDGILKLLGRIEEGAAREVGEVEKALDLSLDYDTTLLEPLAMASHVPPSHAPSVEWLRAFASSLSTIIKNGVDAVEPSTVPDFERLLAEAEEGDLVDLLVDLAHDANDLPSIVKAVLAIRASGDRPSSPDGYRALLRTIQIPPNALRPIELDADFARMMVAGPNPFTIARVREGENILVVRPRPGADDLLDALRKASVDKRLFACDYHALASLPSGSFPRAKKVVSGPIAYFVLGEDQTLAPAAISFPGLATFVPGDGDTWKAAKAAVVAADLTLHEAVVHLAKTHLFVEPFVVATERVLSKDHPVYRLLRPHFDGTLFINDLAMKALVNPGGAVNELTGPTIDATRAAVAESLTGLGTRTVRDGLELDFDLRGVGDASLLPDYPYRDDARLLWSAIERWTRAYVAIAYADSDAVKNDAELQAWVEDIGSNQGGRTAVGPVDGVGVLAWILARIIFTASAEHAAVNFPQAEMIDVANFPLAAYAPPPRSPDDGPSLLATLPPTSQALHQVSLLYLLSSVRVKRLGEYDEGWFTSTASDALANALARFRKDLADAEATIQKRNETRRPYTYLLPSNIPRSIDI